MKHDEHLCAEIEGSLPLYVGGDLEERALAQVREHLAACPRCGERALAARAVRRELVRALRLDGRSGPDLWSGVRAVLADDGALPAPRPEPATLRPAPRAAPRRWGGWRVAAAASIAIAFGFWAGARWADDPASEPLPGLPPAVAEVPAPGEVPVVPVSATTNGLRRLKPGEARLRDTALPLYSESILLNGIPTDGAAPAQPASLQRVGPGRRGW
jgi:anti-sigma factor RsiW